MAMSNLILSSRERRAFFDRIERGRERHIYTEAVFRKSALEKVIEDKKERENDRTGRTPSQ
jgi:hypothetical protein